MNFRLFNLILLTFAFVDPAFAQQSVDLEYAPAPVDNPLKGLVPYARPHADRFPHSMEFSYFPLSKLVIRKDKYDFQPLEKLLDDIASRGNQTVFRIFLEYPGKKNVIPKYLIDGGLKVHKYLNTNTHPFPPQEVETPDYEDQNLRTALKSFVAELGKRYDGDPRVAYITAGLLGTWGEWHTYPKTELWASKAVQIEVLDAYEKAFQKTPILLRYPAGQGNILYASTAERKFGYHDDSFAFATLVSGKKKDDWFFQKLMKDAKADEVWKKHPIGGEIRPECWGCCFDEKPCTPKGQEFAKCRDELHASWMMDTGMFRKKANATRYKRAIEQVRRMGYEFYVSQSTINHDGKEIIIRLNVENRGIAPFYHSGWPIEVSIAETKDGATKIVKTWSTDWTLTGILPASNPTIWQTKIKTDAVLADTKFLIRVVNPMDGGKILRFANRNQDRDVPGWLTVSQ